jgi:hypothetical protein
VNAPAISLRDFVSKGIILGDRGRRIEWCPALEELSAIEREEIKSVALVMPRRSGKSSAAAAVSFWHAMTTPHAEVVLVAATGGSIEEIFRQKLVTSLLGDRFTKAGIAAEPTKTKIYFPSLNSSILCIAPSEANTVGKTVTLLVCDECRLISEETVRLLEPSTFATGKRIFIGTAGRPRTWWEDCFKDPSPSHHSRIFTSVEDAGNPALDLRAEAASARARAERGGNYQLMLYRRDFESVFTELAEGSPLVNPGDVERASRESVPAYDPQLDTVILAGDLSVTTDLTSLVAVARRDSEEPSPSGGGPLRVLEIVIFDPAASGGRVDLSSVEAKILTMARLYNPEQILLDQYQGILLAQNLAGKGLTVNALPITAQRNQAIFSSLAEALQVGRLSWARHERLERELLGLSIQETSAGFRVLDGKRLHRDVSFSLVRIPAKSATYSD